VEPGIFHTAFTAASLIGTAVDHITRGKKFPYLIQFDLEGMNFIPARRIKQEAVVF
jgi:hypothetical protein